jgi:DNA-directed RNA polymerase subunit K/omega
MESSIINRNDIADSLKNQMTTNNYYSKYEYTALLAVRSQQIAEGAKILVSTDGLDKNDIRFIEHVARREIEQQVLPFIISRQLPNGSREYLSAQNAEIIR